MATVTLGSGKNTLALLISEDAWQGDAQFIISVDGKQIGGILTASALKGSGQSQLVNVMGDWSGAHKVSVNFLNDAWGGTPTTDRNLYVNSATIDGVAVPGSSLALYAAGAQGFAFTPPDKLDLHISEDPWQGDAQYTIQIDGETFGGVRTATASHAAGATQDVVIASNWGSGAHSIGVTFINDAWGGSSSTDRNLYVDKIAYDGQAVSGAPLEIGINETVTFAVAATAPGTPVVPPVETFAASARGGSMLPTGYLSTKGNQTVDASGNPVRIASIGWYGTDGPAGSALQGLWATSYGNILQSIKADGFNTVRIPWSNADLNTPFAGTNQLGGVDWSQNADLQGLTTLQVFHKVVDAAGQIGLKVIFDHHTNDGSGGQQPNGLWIDKGPGTDNTDGAGVTGTVDAAKFQADWVQVAQSFAGNSTVIGYDLDNEPLATLANWGAGGPTDIQQMYTDVGNAVQAADPGALIIAEGLITSDGTGYPQLLTGAKDHPVTLKVPNKVVYSVHDYPAEIGGQAGDASGPAAIQAMTDHWGFLETQNIAPVWIGEMGSNMTLAGSKVWAATLLDYMNGKDGAQGGPTFTGKEQGVAGSWWNIGWEGGQGNPDGNQTAWGIGNYKPEQQAVTDQLLFKPH